MVTGGMIFTTALLIAIFMPKGQSLAEQNQSKEGAAGYGILTILKVPGVLLATLSIITGAFSIGFLSSSLEPHIRQVCRIRMSKAYVNLKDLRLLMSLFYFLVQPHALTNRSCFCD